MAEWIPCDIRSGKTRVGWIQNGHWRHRRICGEMYGCFAVITWTNAIHLVCGKIYNKLEWRAVFLLLASFVLLFIVRHKAIQFVDGTRGVRRSWWAILPRSAYATLILTQCCACFWGVAGDLSFTTSIAIATSDLFDLHFVCSAETISCGNSYH